MTATGTRKSVTPKGRSAVKRNAVVRKGHLAHFSRAVDLLIEIAASTEDLLIAMQNPRFGARMGAGVARDYLTERLRNTQRQASYRLKRAGYIVECKTADGLVYALSEKGVAEYVRQRILRADMMDGDEVCMVMFDIPEKHRALRRELCTFLESAGFIPYQKSVFISPFDAFDDLALLFALKGADRWIKVYRAVRVMPKGRSAVKRNAIVNN